MNAPSDELNDALVAVMWPRFGPYHVARLDAAARLFQGRSCRIIGIETAEAESTYSWEPIEAPPRVRRETLFPGAEYSKLASRSLRSAARDALARVDPAAVAVCGWSLVEAREAIAWCRRNGRGAILMSDSKRDDAPRRPWRERIKSRIVSLCDAGLVAGSPHKEYLVELGMPSDAVFMGYDVVGNDYFSQAAASLHDSLPAHSRELGARRFFLASNRFIPRKNLSALLAAYARYREAVGDAAWDLVLLGDGPGRKFVEEAIERFGLRGVHLAGFRQVHELPAYYAAAACFVHPAMQDQWGLVVNEAMACGLPVLVSKTAGCRYDLVEEGGNGWTFDPSSADDVARALFRMHHLPPARRREMGERSRLIIADWGPDRFAHALWQAACVAVERARQREPGLALVDRLILRG